MWKKTDDDQPDNPTAVRPEPPAQRREPPRPAGVPGERATIGRSITIRGEVSGDEDLLIQGRIDGSVDLKQHAVTVGAEGRVTASISGRIVTVEGEVEGDLTAQEQVVLRSSAKVQGDITAPRVVLEDGASFRGGVDMGDSRAPQGRNGGGRSTPAPGAAAGAGTGTGAGAGAGGAGTTTPEPGSPTKVEGTPR